MGFISLFIIMSYIIFNACIFLYYDLKLRKIPNYYFKISLVLSLFLNFFESILFFSNNIFNFMVLRLFFFF